LHQRREASWLVVRGDVIVSGLYRDTCNQAPDVVWIGGDLRAADVVTGGRLVVQGDLRTTGCIVGDYNDGGTHVHGNVDAQLLAMFDHPYRIEGKIRARFVLADIHAYLRDDPAPKGETRWADLPLAGKFTPNDLIARLRKRQAILRK